MGPPSTANSRHLTFACLPSSGRLLPALPVLSVMDWIFFSHHWCLLYNLQVIQRVMGQLVMSLALTRPNTPVSEQADLLRGYMYNFDC